MIKFSGPYQKVPFWNWFLHTGLLMKYPYRLQIIVRQQPLNLVLASVLDDIPFGS